MVGVDYPAPMINHAEGSRLNIERMKQVYQQLSHYRGLSKDAAAAATGPLVAPRRSTAFGVFDLLRPPGLGADHPGGGGAAPDGRVPEQQRAR